MIGPWIEWDGTWKQFVNAGLNKPGIQVETRVGLNKFFYLLGDCDYEGRSSYGEAAIEPGEIVVRYRDVFAAYRRTDGRINWE